MGWFSRWFKQAPDGDEHDDVLDVEESEDDDVEYESFDVVKYLNEVAQETIFARRLPRKKLPDGRIYDEFTKQVYQPLPTTKWRGKPGDPGVKSVPAVQFNPGASVEERATPFLAHLSQPLTQEQLDQAERLRRLIEEQQERQREQQLARARAARARNEGVSKGRRGTK